MDFDIHRQAATIAFGRPVAPRFKIDAASVIVSLDSDFIGGEDNLHVNIRQFAAGRRTQTSADPVSRLYAVEGLMTLTGANADHRLRLATSVVPAAAALLAVEVLQQSGRGAADEAVQSLARSFTGNKDWVHECAADLVANPGAGLVLAGHRQPLVVHLIAHTLNAALGNLGKTVVMLDAPEPGAGTIADLAKSLNDGSVDSLVILGGNPAYNAPADLNWAQAQSKAKTVVRLGYYEDESLPQNGWSLPLAHFLESWGDARTSDGTLVPVQPLIEPLFGGLTELEVMARIAGLDATAPYDIVRETFTSLGAGDFEAWKHFLHDGYLKGSAAKPVDVSLNAPAVSTAISNAGLTSVTAPSTSNLEVVFHRDYKMDDGRFNNNGWMQELPDPLTKLTWENVILMSVKTAKDLGLFSPDNEKNRILAKWAKIELDGRTVEGPVWTVPGQADNSIALALGYGRTQTGRVGRNSGYNAYAIRTTKNLHCALGAKISDTGGKHPLSVTQDHGTMEGRPIIREGTLAEYRDYKGKHPEGNFAKGFDLEKPPVFAPLYPNPFDELKKTGVHQWGMSIDLSACVGCASCMVACQSENNVPIVGKQQVANNREMHWIRIDRYFTGDPDKEDGIQVVNQPMLCQHCEAAPCENVCPVNATTHDQEGLNVMVYNRCVGTRYCQNNCPYKVRRFNFFDYNRRTLEQLRGPVYSTPLLPGNGQSGVLDWLKDPDRGNKPQDEWDLMKMVKNPDVTVRMRGVMEKCSYCLQRIEHAKIDAKVRAGASGDWMLKESEGTVPKTACQQACPAEAIVFGNIADPDSRVAKLKAQDRDYNVLDFLNTRPRTTYLAKLRNPNPKMPDAYEMPNSTRDFEDKNEHANPFENKDAWSGAEAGKGAS